MRVKRPFLIALGFSLALHAAAIESYFGYAHYWHWRWGSNESTAEEWAVYLDEMGDANGTGIGSNSSPGARPLRARQADADQALLNRDPVGFGRTLGQRSRWTGSVGDNGGGGPPTIAAAVPPALPQRAELPPRPAQPNLIPPAEVASRNQVMSHPEEMPRPSPAIEAMPIPQAPAASLTVASAAVNAKPAEQGSVPQAMAARASSAQQTAAIAPIAGAGRRPGSPHPPAMALPPSDSDSDPFSRVSGAVEFHDGQLVVRRGRKVKTKAPELSIAGQVDLLKITDPRVVFEIHIGAEGNVTDVRIARSSGSNLVDEPTRLAIYDWWFEPRRAAGKGVPDVTFFEVDYR